MDALRVTVRRGGTVESTHGVHAVAVRQGRIVASIGDPKLVTFMRSSAKPLQALPLVQARHDLDAREIAIASASHLGEPAQLAAVRSLLAKGGATEDDLECGPEGRPPARIKHNCSGKHAGMLALCAANGWQRAGYRLPEHPLQLAMLTEIAAAMELPEQSILRAVDGCGVVTFAMPLERMAHAFARFESLEGGSAVAGAMRAHPELIRGAAAPDTRLMRALPGWLAKGGAEGLFCASDNAGTGIALKVADGNARALEPALAIFLRTLGHRLDGFTQQLVRNSRQEVVGEIVGEP